MTNMNLLIILMLLFIIPAFYFWCKGMDYNDKALAYLNETSEIFKETDKIWYKINSGALKTEEELNSAINEIVKYHAQFDKRMEYYDKHFK